MSIGIFDADWTLKRVVPFNLQAMKLSTYYKRKREIVLRDTEFKPEQHQLVYVCKDFDDGNYPAGLLSAPNVRLVGRAFTGGVYQPMPLEIERVHPDTHFYEKDEALLAYSISKGAGRLMHSMGAAEHLRLSLDGQNVWSDYPSQILYRKKVWNAILHDDNLAQIKDGYKEVQNLYKYLNGDTTKLRIGCKFPIMCTDHDMLMNWSKIRSSRVFYAIGYNGLMEDEELIDWLGLPWYKQTPRYLRYQITGKNFDYQSFINGGINQLFRQAVISRCNNTILLLLYEDGYFRDKRWAQVLNLITQFQQWRSKNFVFIDKMANDKMIDYVRWLPRDEFERQPLDIRVFTREELRPLFAFVRTNNPDLFNDFYTLSFASLQGG